MDTTTQRIADRIEGRRIEKNISISHLALSAGLPRTTFKYRLAGHGDFTIPQLAAIGKVLDIPFASWAEQVAA